jgi:hypothetical protein
MALGTITVTNDERKQASAPLGFAELSFPGDDSYPNPGGTLTFQASVRTAMGRDVTVLGVVPLDLNGGYRPIYNKATDALQIVVEATGVEVANGVALNGVTFKIGVWYQ